MSLQIRRLLLLLTLAVAVAGCYWSVRLGRADWAAGQATISAVSESVRLAPGNSSYVRHAAEIREAEGLPESGLRELAARINPLDSGNWIHLATRAEMEGRIGEAKNELLRAFEVDRQFDPRWALANFYFRQGNPQRSLEWIRKTLEFGGGDLTSVFRLCWTVNGNGNQILDGAIPQRAEMLAKYLTFLDGSGRVEEASETAKVLLPQASVEQVQVLMAHCSKSLENGKAEAAMAVWNGLIGRGLIAGERVEPGAGRPSVDTGFQKEMTGQGFEWGVQRVDGVAVERLPDRRGVRVIFSRKEPEHYTILGQWVALAPQKIYQFGVAYAASGTDGAGLKWVIYSPQTKAVLMSAGLTKEGLESHMIKGRFESPADWHLARLELRYDREPGTVRPEGSIEFSRLVLESPQ